MLSKTLTSHINGAQLCVSLILIIKSILTIHTSAFDRMCVWSGDDSADGK